MVLAQSQESPPGLIEGLQILMQSRRENRSVNSINARISLNREEIKSSQLNPEFLKNVFLYTEPKWLNYLKQSDCSFLSLLHNNLIQNETGEIKEIPLITKSGKNVLIPKNEFIKKTLEFKCFNNSQIAKLFSRENVKSTLSKFKYHIPKKQSECKKIVDDWKTNAYLPYLCQIPQAISRGRKAELRLNNTKNLNFKSSQKLSFLIRNYQWYNNNIDFFKRNYLNHLCRGLDSVSLFCDPYLAKDVWFKIVNGEHLQEKLFYKCKNLQQKSIIGRKELENCASTMNQSPEICTHKTASGYPSLFPRPNCRSISMALNSAMLRTSYHDCPANVDNLTITNTHRIIHHFRPQKINSKPFQCFGETYYSLNKLNQAAKMPTSWPLQLCYHDRIQEKKVCHDYIPGRLGKKPESLGEESVVSLIMKKVRGMEKNGRCVFIEKSKYNPSLVDYKNGCFIVVDTKKCSTSFCPRKIFLDGKMRNDITYKRSVYFQYFPTNYAKKKSSVSNMLSTSYNLKAVRLNSLTELEIFLKNNRPSLAHGIGCAENILPQFFKIQGLNQCSPMPFIVDGVVRKNKNRFLVLRTAIDDIHSPRLILWGFVFSALSNFSKIHSLNLWTLNGIKS